MSMQDTKKVILTDCDGVLLNWEYAFTVWMASRNYKVYSGKEENYDIGERYCLDKKEKRRLVKDFNESAAIGFLPPLRDAMYYVDLLHRKHGYVFHMITSLSLDSSAQALRIQNTRKLFGETAFEKFVFLDTGADKDDALNEYKDTGHIWIEDKFENAECGDRCGLESILVEHSHNMNNDKFPTFASWKEIYEYIAD